MTRPTSGPSLRSRKPDLVAQLGACDCHCHIFGPSDVFPYAPERDYTPPDAPLEDYLRLLDALGLERTVIVQPSVYGTDNACTEDAVRRMNGRARGVAVVSAGVGEDELARLSDAGFRGLRFNLMHTGGSAPLDALEVLAAKVAPLAWHVQIYLHGRLLPDLLPRLKMLPVDLVVDHMGHFEAGRGPAQPGFQALLQLMERGRCWLKLCPYRFDLTGPPYIEAQALARVLNDVAPEHLLWGTDWPHPNTAGTEPEAVGAMPDDADLLDALGVWFEDSATIERILVVNPAKLYGFGPRGV